jgi:heme-degrading monooxygenase HmoA
MSFFSMMMVKVLEGQAEEAAQVWIKNRIVEAAAETVPGFLQGEVMLSTDEPDQVCVMCGWEDKAAYEEWRNSPVRANITTDLSGAVSFDIKTVCFQSIHTVSK